MSALGWCLTGVACWIAIALFAWCLCRVAAAADRHIDEATKDLPEYDGEDL
jgi:hypothetical protein